MTLHTRRTALFLMSAAALSAASRVSPASASQARRLSFEHIHTGERLSASFRTGIGYDPGALDEINHILRDWRTGEVHQIDPALLDDIHDLQARLGHAGPVRVISGYRSPRTNAALGALAFFLLPAGRGGKEPQKSSGSNGDSSACRVGPSRS